MNALIISDTVFLTRWSGGKTGRGGRGNEAGGSGGRRGERSVGGVSRGCRQSRCGRHEEESIGMEQADLIIGLASGEGEFSRNRPLRPMVPENEHSWCFIVGFGFGRLWSRGGIGGKLRWQFAGASEYRRAREDTADRPGTGPEAGGDDPAVGPGGERIIASPGPCGGRAGVDPRHGKQEKARRVKSVACGRAEPGEAIGAVACASARVGDNPQMREKDLTRRWETSKYTTIAADRSDYSEGKSRRSPDQGDTEIVSGARSPYRKMGCVGSTGRGQPDETSRPRVEQKVW